MELVIVIVVVGVISVTLLPFFRININSYLTVRAGKDLMQSSRIGLERMLAELGTVPASSDIDFGLSDEIQFDTPMYSNVNYEFRDGALVRSEGLFGGVSKVVIGVKSFQISFYDEAGTQIPSFYWPRNDIRRIQLEMTVGDDDRDYELCTQIAPRNFY